jgi:hypothetical protein
MSTFPKVFHSLLFLSFITHYIHAQEWSTEKDKNGVKVETRYIDGWNIKEYRATVFIETSLEKAVHAYKDPVERKKFYERAVLVSNLKEISENEIITYLHGKAPWPVQDRDNVTHSTFSKPDPKTVRITMHSVPDFIPVKKDIVRIPKSKGYWLFKDMGNGKIKVVQQSVADLGGSIPDWVVNSTIIEGPYDTLLALKNLLEGH